MFQASWKIQEVDSVDKFIFCLVGKLLQFPPNQNKRILQKKMGVSIIYHIYKYDILVGGFNQIWNHHLV